MAAAYTLAAALCTGMLLATCPPRAAHAAVDRSYTSDGASGSYAGGKSSAGGGGASSAGSGSMECFSCMSLSYQENWPHLGRTYEMPHSFTNRCNEPWSGGKGIGTVECSAAGGDVCVMLKEPQVQAGVHIGDLFIRGCLSKLLKNDFNRSAIATHGFTRYNNCRTLPRGELFNRAPGSSYMWGDVYMCSCYGHLCNGAQRSHHAPRRKAAGRYMAAAAVALVLWPFLNDR